MKFLPILILAIFAACSTPNRTPTPPNNPNDDAIYEIPYTQARVISRPSAPHYPQEARNQNIQGAVEIAVVINKEGTPISAEIVNGPKELHDTCINFAMSWHFAPYIINSHPRSIRIHLTTKFILPK